MIDNRDIVRRFIDNEEDGDTFWYTELLDRTTNGSNRFKMLRSFEHNCRAEFDEQCDTIAKLCESNNVRAYTRLTPRSRKQVAHHLLRAVTDQVLDGHYAALGHTYASSCGKTNIHSRRVWTWDIDQRGAIVDMLANNLACLGKLRAIIPSRQGCHLVTPGFDTRDSSLQSQMKHVGATIHKDNPTNLYIPENAK